MNKEYWDKYYKTRNRQAPSDFVQFCAKYIEVGSTILDLGCGDGRDSAFLRTYGEVVAVDQSGNLNLNGVEFIRQDMIEFLQEDRKFDVMYVRWVFHAVPEEVEDLILDYAQRNARQLLAEFRVIGDVSDDTHWRRPIDLNDFAKKLFDRGFNLNYMNCEQGYSKLGEDDPFLARIVGEFRNC